MGVNVNPFKWSYKGQSLSNTTVDGHEVGKAIGKPLGSMYRTMNAIPTAITAAITKKLAPNSKLNKAAQDSRESKHDVELTAAIAAAVATVYFGGVAAGAWGGAGAGAGAGAAAGAGAGATTATTISASDALMMYAASQMTRKPGEAPPPILNEVLTPPDNTPSAPELSSRSLAALGKKRGRASTILTGGGRDVIGSSYGRKSLIGM